jgi:ADP-heptose:LPS heptosyltransferase
MDYSLLLKLDRRAGGLSRSGTERLRRITDPLVRRFGRARPTAEGPAPLSLADPPRRVLILKLWGLGNLVLAGRALQSLRTAWPEATITLLTTPGCDRVYDANRLYDETILFDPEDGRLARLLTDVQDQLLERQYDLAVNLEGISELARALTLRSGAKATVGLAREEEGNGGYDGAASFQPGCHVEDLAYSCARAAGGAKVPPGLVRPQLRSQERGFCEEILNRFGAEAGELLLGIHPGIGDFAPERAWPAEKFALLAQQLEGEPEFRTVFFGGPGEERTVKRAARLMEEAPLNVAGALSIRQFMAFLERLHLFIGNDSGPAHLAAAMDIPTVTIFGPESPARVGRRSSERHATVYRRTGCSPCVSLFGLQRGCLTCGGECVAGITVEEVSNVAHDLLDHLSDPDEPPWMSQHPDA